jgi:hypothetical protein
MQAHSCFLTCGSSSIWLERFPVTEEVAGSSPVSRARSENAGIYSGIFCISLVYDGT